MTENPAASAGPFPVGGLIPPTQRTGAKRRIGDVIVMLGFAERALVESVVSEGRARGVPLGQSLIAAGVVDSNQLAHALAERNGLDFVDLNRGSDTAPGCLEPQCHPSCSGEEINDFGRERQRSPWRFRHGDPLAATVHSNA